MSISFSAPEVDTVAEEIVEAPAPVVRVARTRNLMSFPPELPGSWVTVTKVDDVAVQVA